MRLTICVGLFLVAIIGLGWGNYLVGLRLLGLNDRSFADSLSKLSHDVKPVMLNGSEPQLIAHAQSALIDKGFKEAEIKALPTNHNLEIQVAWIQAANPYPPLLAEYEPNYIKFWNWSSFGYIGRDGRYHQITYYGGEADTTPSFLVQKVRGPKTGYGDYFIGYIVAVSRGLKPIPEIVGPGGQVERWQKPRITVDRIDWLTYRGGSYDAVEEIHFTLYSTVGEVALLLLVLAFARLRTKRRRLAAVGQPETRR